MNPPFIYHYFPQVCISNHFQYLFKLISAIARAVLPALVAIPGPPALHTKLSHDWMAISFVSRHVLVKILLREVIHVEMFML